MTRFAMIVVTALAVAAAGCGGSDASSNSTHSTSSASAEIVSADSLRETASEAIPIYWAGEREGTKLELSRPDKKRTYVRYLTGDAEAGDKRADFLTVSTYVESNAVVSLRRQSKRSGGTLGHAPGNATVYFDRENPQSVYLAYPGAPVEVEVFDPNFKRALGLVDSGQIVAVE